MRLSIQRALRFLSQGSHLVGVIDVPERPFARGMLVLTPDSGYRVGRHRQFTLLARVVAKRGSPVMRFDLRGCGDSEGEPQAVHLLDHDIDAAVAEFFRQIPQLREVVILGLGDGATAAALHAHLDSRIKGLILLNPRILGSAGGLLSEARQPYFGRLGEIGFWKKIASASAASQHQTLREAAMDRGAALPRRLLASLACFEGKILLVYGAADLDAQAFASLLGQHDIAFKRVEMPGASPTFINLATRELVAQACANWISSW
jgi:exosortase A-associated hydrolase 1